MVKNINVSTLNKILVLNFAIELKNCTFAPENLNLLGVKMFH